MTKTFDGVTITTGKGQEISVEDYLTADELKRIERQRNLESTGELRTRYFKPRERHRAYGERHSPIKHIRRESMGKEPAAKKVIRAILSQPDKWMMGSEYRTKDFEDINHNTFLTALSAVSLTLIKEGQMVRRPCQQKAKGVMYEYKYQPNAEWMTKTNDSFDAMVDEIYEMYKQFRFEQNQASLNKKERKARGKEIPGVQGGPRKDQGAAVATKPLPDKVTMGDKQFEQMIQMLFDRIDKKIEERFVLSEKGLTNLQDQITELKQIIEDPEGSFGDVLIHNGQIGGRAVQDVNVNVRFGWLK